MEIFLTGKSNVGDLVIDFIEMKLITGKIVSLDWDDSYIERGDDGSFDFTYEGININGESARGKLSELKGATVVAVGLYSESCDKADLDILEMTIRENDVDLTLESPYSVKCEDARG